MVSAQEAEAAGFDPAGALLLQIMEHNAAENQMFAENAQVYWYEKGKTEGYDAGYSDGWLAKEAVVHRAIFGSPPLGE